MVSMIELGMRSLINLLVYKYKFNQLAEVQLALHGLEQNQYLLPMRCLKKYT